MSLVGPFLNLGLTSVNLFLGPQIMNFQLCLRVSPLLSSSSLPESHPEDATPFRPCVLYDGASALVVSAFPSVFLDLVTSSKSSAEQPAGYLLFYILVMRGLPAGCSRPQPSLVHVDPHFNLFKLPLVHVDRHFDLFKLVLVQIGPHFDLFKLLLVQNGPHFDLLVQIGPHFDLFTFVLF